MINYIDCDMRKFNIIRNIYKNDKDGISEELISKYFEIKTLSNDVKDITHKILTNNFSIDEHNKILGETERTTVALLWHENIVDLLPDKNPLSINVYLKVLDNICFSDYIDRITFQKQIWQFNEMSSLIKTFYNNFIIKGYLDNDDVKSKYLKTDDEGSEIRFTKILTKYSTEYNNFLFIQMFCQELMLDKNDMVNYFVKLKEEGYDTEKIVQLHEHTNLTNLDINRLYRYIND